ncbi:hypothetical protein [Enorma phocaeensis]|uniref:hypothetical protein n=1 Tax=Enorma phocaeensis TaxID=1871019 RepID=UPI003208C06D
MFYGIKRFIIRMVVFALLLFCMMAYCTAHVPDPDTGFNPMGQQVFVPEGAYDVGAVRELVPGTNLEEFACSFDPELYPDYYAPAGDYFTEPPLDVRNGIYFGEVDELGRASGAAGWITNDMRTNASDARADIMDMKDNPWVTVPGTPGRYGYEGNLFEPVNLIPPSLGGDNAAHNIVRGTVMLDEGDGDTPGGLAYTEAIVNSWLDDHPEGRIWYFVQPLYGPGEVIPRALAAGIVTEDRSLDMVTLVYNTANGLDIDYATGEVTPVR